MEPEPRTQSELILYQADDGVTRIEVRLQGETVWLSLNQMAELFQRDKSVISKHIKNVFDEGELSLEATVAKFATVQTEGVREVSREIEFYNLEVIISVGYRVKSQRGTQFRIEQDGRIPDDCRSTEQAAGRRKDHDQVGMGLTEMKDMQDYCRANDVAA